MKLFYYSTPDRAFIQKELQAIRLASKYCVRQDFPQKSTENKVGYEALDATVKFNHTILSATIPKLSLQRLGIYGLALWKNS